MQLPALIKYVKVVCTAVHYEQPIETEGLLGQGNQQLALHVWYKDRQDEKYIAADCITN